MTSLLGVGGHAELAIAGVSPALRPHAKRHAANNFT